MLRGCTLNRIVSGGTPGLISVPGGTDVSARRDQSECPAGPICLPGGTNLPSPSVLRLFLYLRQLFGVAGVFVLPSFRFQYFFGCL